MSDPGKIPSALENLKKLFKDMPELTWNVKNITLYDIFDGIVFDYAGGACPVQAEGTYQDQPFYFRYRWGEASLGWGNDPIFNPVYQEAQLHGDAFDGFLTLEEFEELFKNLLYSLVKQRMRDFNGH